MSDRQRLVATAGLPWRREFRRWLQARDIPFTEDKGWLSSQFVAQVTPLEADVILKFAAQFRDD